MVLSLSFLVVLTALSEIVNPVKWSWDVSIDSVKAEGSITFTAKIDDGFHIYGLRELKGGPVPTSFSFTANDDIVLTGDIEPSYAPSRHVDKLFDLTVEEWSGSVSFVQKFKFADGVSSSNIKGTIRSMACNNVTCTTPASVPFDIAVSTSKGQANKTSADESKNETVSGTNDDVSQITDAESADWWAPVDTKISGTGKSLTGNTSWWSLLLMGFLGGLLALLTPCVWPMIPMTVSFFLKKSKNRSKSVFEACIYGLSIVVIYLVMGIAITLMFGAGKLNDIATSAGFNVAFFILLVVFAISFFGAFDIKLPSKWSNAVDNKAEKTTGLLSIFFMAFTLVLVSFSCTGPIIGTLLVEAASNDSILGPALGMGGFALGLALPFSLFAFFPSLLKEMPKSGGWMNSVKVVLGFIELILSLKFLSVADLAYGWRILDREVFLALWITLFTLLGLYLLGKLRFSHDADKGHTTVGGFFLAVCSFAFAVYLLPGLWGAPLKSISAFAPPLTTQDFNLYGGVFKEFDDYDKGMAYAAENNKPVLLDFSGYGCVNCRKMEGAVFDNEEVRKAIEDNYVMIKLMVDDKTALDKPVTVTENSQETVLTTVGEKWAYLQRHKFNINSQPYYVLLDNKGQMLAPSRAWDENVDAFLQWLDAGCKAYDESNNKK